MNSSKKRVIPLLLVQNGRLVKTKRFTDGIYLGDPTNTISIFNEKEVDEIIVLDITASKKGRGPNLEMIRRVYNECFMPLGYGGGVSSFDDIENIFSIGIEKVVINHSKGNNSLIERGANRYGSQSLVGAIDIVSHNGEMLCFDHVSGQSSLEKPITVAKELEQRGVGEIFINDVSRDGMRIGYAADWYADFACHLSVPVIACGGAGCYEDLYHLLNTTQVSAAAAGSVFTLYGKHEAPLLMYPTYAELKKKVKTNTNE